MSPSPDTSTDTSADDVMEALVRSAFQVMGVMTRISAEHDLSLTQLRVLGILRDRRPRVTELATFLGLDKSTMSGLIDRAERRGLLKRGKNPHDKRVVDVYLTPAGHELEQRLTDEFRRDLAPVVDRLTHQQRVEFTRLFEPLLSPPLVIKPRVTPQR